jgi:peptidoglycan hydrolase-like protein with peptidoglycan-binding domain
MTRHERRDGPAGLAVGLLALALALPAAAQTPAAKPAPTPRPAGATTPAPSIDPVLDAARLVYEARPLAERVAIQDGLVWTGDYSGALDGTFGRMTFQAITAFQTRHRFTPDGILTAPALKLLAETATGKKAAVGFQPVDDKATGVRIHLPTRLLGPPAKREAGSRWVGREGRVQIDTYAFTDTDLAGFFERMKAETPGRKVVYAVLRPEWFVISDETGGRHGYTRFVRGPGGIRGFLFSVDASLGAELDRVVIATAGRFEPFPGATPVAGATTPTPGPATPTAPTTPTTPAATPVVSSVPAASGLVVADGRVLTAAAAVAEIGRAHV